MGRDRHNLLLAEAMDTPEVRARVADAVRPIANGFDAIGFPAVLGLRDSGSAVSDLEQQIGLPVFEIPTLPPSVPGQRLMDTLDAVAVKLGVVFKLSRRALSVEHSTDRLLVTLAGKEGQEESIEARGVLLTTGRFMGGGLAADLNGIRETLLDLPVHQPATREDWHREQFFHPNGHPVNRAGLRIDDHFRPLGESGGCAFINLFAAGSILAHQDWVREKSGAGLAIATAWGAVEAFRQMPGALSEDSR
jgi:glycerol-3-phosphate dehydrogenase subunit B